MKKNFLYILFSVIILIASCFSYWFYSLVAKWPHLDFSKTKEYFFLFKDSEIKNLDRNLCSTEVGNKYVYNFFNYKHVDFISVWEFKKLKKLNFRTPLINQNKHLDNKKFEFGMGDIAYHNPIILYGNDIEFNDNFQIDLDEKSIINKLIDGPNYSGFYAEINGMAFANGERNVIRFNYPKGKVSTMLILYKKSNNFYVIMVRSNKSIDPNVIKIFNLQ